jgi:ankyrin repeat protein
MPNFFAKIKTRFSSPSSKSKSTGDLSFSSSQGYVVEKEKELPKLHLAAWKGQLSKVTELCRPDKINLLDRENRTALHLAVSADHLQVVERLLMEDAKIAVLVNLNGN